MNQIDCVVTVVKTQPYTEYGKWWVGVQYESWGRTSETVLMCDTREDADRIGPGHKFLA
ncbi:hypothetical protein [Burkholderia ubonensis]|uniref:hypothetical protein n=1 Tax=Burkholderia ubonensis TaxID=101571 RepID=UPI000A4DDD19|nr:hypothetical protein [Burkholderia ubonensis]